MSSYHILYAYGEDTKYALEVEYHVPVPDETLPLTGENLRTQLAADDDYEKTSDVADAGELTNLGNGSLVKIVERIKANSNLSNAAIRNSVRSRYLELEEEAVEALRLKYKGTGFGETWNGSSWT